MFALTEDDTYLALRRVPLHEMNRRVGVGEAEIVYHNHHLTLLAQELMDKRKKWAKVREFIRYLNPKYGADYTFNFHQFNPVIDQSVFIGTGWTYDQWMDTIEQQVQDEFDKECEEKKLKDQKFILGILCIGQIWPWAGFFFGPFPMVAMIVMPLTIGVAGGLLLSKWLNP